MQKLPKVYFKTFGCRTNQFDTQLMMQRLTQGVVTMDEEEADIVVINSCTVTNSADSSVRSYIGSLERRRPGVRIMMTGCGVYGKGEELFAEGRINALFGHSEKRSIDRFVTATTPLREIGDLEYINDAIVGEMIGKSRAFVKIQEGCDFACSYCIIPFVRGRARSHDEAVILEQIEKLAAHGLGEFILTGTNMGSYGRERGESLATLLPKIAAIRGVRRIRLGSLEPIQVDDALLELLDEPWMAKHLHIALQHTSNRMLEAMNRRNRYRDDLALFEKIAGHGYALGTDFIVGFPGESHEIWKEAMENARRLPLTHIHLFTYSPREGTPSARLRQDVPGDVAKERSHELRTLVKEKNFAFRKALTTPLRVLVEEVNEGVYEGYDQYYNRVKIYSDVDITHCWIDLDDYEIHSEGNRGRFAATS
ncbi:MAG: tRNA (N(6)-L-threonylcarbamoyladenosine(37)-C(2))-methylthiotransferase MtaB [Campylobacterales bacterium]